MRASISIRKNENIGLPRHVIDMSYIIFHHNTAAIYAVYLGTRVMRKHHFTQISLQHVFRRCCDQTFRFSSFYIQKPQQLHQPLQMPYCPPWVIWDEIGASRTDLFCTTRSLPHGPANQYHKTVESQGFLWLPWKNPKSDSVTTVPLAKNDWNWCPHDADLIFRQKIQSVSLLG